MSEKTDWTLVTLKEHFETLLEERDKALKAASLASQEAINKASNHLDEILQGFPQEYGRKDDFETLRKEINNIKVDHVQRREFDTLKDEQTQGRGARLAIFATAGIVVTLIAVALGAMYANQLTHKSVSDQIQIEAPWLADKPALEEEIQQLQQQVILLKTQLAAHEATDKIRAALKK